jgi:hypothetical protein
VSEDQRSESARPRKRRGRPPLPPGASKAKRETLTIRVTSGLKDALWHATKASGRSVAAEIQHRLRRSLDDDDIDVDDDETLTERRREILLSRLERKYPELVIQELEAMAAEFSAHARELDHYRQQRAAGVPHDDIRGPAPIAEKPEPQTEAVELEVGRAARGGNVVLVARRGGLVIQETQTLPDIVAALQLVGDVELAVSESGEPERKSRRRA